MDAQQLADRKAIAEVIHRYPHCLDTGQFGRVAQDVFAKDGELDFGGGNGIKGAANIAAALSGFSTVLRRCAHNVTNLVIHVNGDSAQATYRILCWHWFVHDETDPMAPSEVTIVGGYNDRLVRTQIGWRVQHRQGFMLGTGTGEMPDHMRQISVEMMTTQPVWPD